MMLICLEIATYVGIGIGAEHYYGQLRWYNTDGEYQREELTRGMTPHEAIEYNRKDNTTIWRAGAKTSRFADRIQVIEHARIRGQEIADEAGQELVLERGNVLIRATETNHSCA